MLKLNKTKKTIIGIIATIIISIICYYIYTKEDIEFTSQESLEIEQEENSTEKENNEESSNAETIILVHISGAVKKEGIVELKENSRISDAINKAGGLKENADISSINLAYKLEDGMKVYIPNIEEKKQQSEQNTESQKDETSEYIITSITRNQDNQENKKENEKININTATQTQLETLPGIGPSTALKIIAYRKENGKFSNIEEIKEVSGIGEAKYNNIKEHICI